MWNYIYIKGVACYLIWMWIRPWRENQFGGFFLSFIHWNDLEKVWKQEQSVSHGAFTLKKHPALHCKTAENRAKMFKINKMAKQITFWRPIWVPKVWMWGFCGLVWSMKVVLEFWFLVPQKTGYSFNVKASWLTTFFLPNFFNNSFCAYNIVYIVYILGLQCIYTL